MSTVIMKISPPEQGAALEEAARVIRSGGLVAFPTESFYALGANALDPKAVERVFRAKRRRDDNPVPVIVHDIDALLAITADVYPDTLEMVKKLTPGPVTLVLTAADTVPDVVTGGSGKVGVRIPADGFMRELARLSGVPVTATSANHSGEPGLTEPGDVLREMGGDIDLLIDGGTAPGPPPSTVLDLSARPPVTLREGRLKPSEINAILGI